MWVFVWTRRRSSFPEKTRRWMGWHLRAVYSDISVDRESGEVPQRVFKKDRDTNAVNPSSSINPHPPHPETRLPTAITMW